VIRRRVSLDGYDGYVWESTGTTVLESSVDGWDAGGVWCPIVWIEDGTWYMLYTSRDADLNNVSTGLATSPDGINWTKSPSNPVIIPTLVWEDGAVE
jgi:beta-xylosidase